MLEEPLEYSGGSFFNYNDMLNVACAMPFIESSLVFLSGLLTCRME
jgi:hypothetical protein